VLGTTRGAIGRRGCGRSGHLAPLHVLFLAGEISLIKSKNLLPPYSLSLSLSLSLPLPLTLPLPLSDAEE
jgi:hypothetical protein